MDPLWGHDDTVMDKEPFGQDDHAWLGGHAEFRVPRTQDQSVWDRTFKCRAT
jgi:hypothetical protein